MNEVYYVTTDTIFDVEVRDMPFKDGVHCYVVFVIHPDGTKCKKVSDWTNERIAREVADEWVAFLNSAAAWAKTEIGKMLS